MSKKVNLLLVLSLVIALQFGVTQTANAMHIMEGYLSIPYAVGWGVICLPFLVYGGQRISRIRHNQPQTIVLLALVGAFAFVLSALKIPSVTGSSSHPTGTGLGAILFGPGPMAIIGLIVLLFQALLLAHGGLTTLGANTFSMGIAGPLVTFGLYHLSRKAKLSRQWAIFLGVSLGNLFTYVVTSCQLGLMYPSAQGGVAASVGKFLGVFALTQVPLAVIEGILSVVVIMALENYARPELQQLGYFPEVSA